MGKHRNRRKKQNVLLSEDVSTVPENDAKAATVSRFSIDQILDKAEECIDQFDYTVAQKFCQRALEIDSDNIRALEVSASLLIEVGEQEKAIQCLGRAVTLKPDEGHQKYLSLAQLQDGTSAASCYNKGIEILAKQLEKACTTQASGTNSEKESDIATVKRDISSAYCALSELYMTDLCFKENAEQQCRENMEKAISADETNAEAYLTMANFLLVKEETEAARTHILQSLALWLPAYQDARDGKGNDPSFDPVEVCPLNYPTRVSTAKILIELEEWDNAVEVLDGLIEEDDTVVDVWYLLGWLNFLRGEDFKGNARYYFNKAVKISKTSKMADKSQVEHALELLQELGPGDELESEDEKENEDEAVDDGEIESTDEEDEKMDEN